MKKNIDTDTLKKIQKELLNVLNKFCEEHKLRYFLSYGTLIGAVRHKGYIPWDDDIDVVMPRYDYDKLISCFNKLNKQSNCRLLHNSIDSDYYLPMAKIVNTDTVLHEDVDFDYNLGIYIDIFPLDNLSDDLSEARKIIKRGFKLNELLLFKTLKWRSERSLINNLIVVIGKIILSFKSYASIIKSIDDYCKAKKSITFSNYIGVIAGLTAGDDTRIYQKEWFEKVKYVQFEGNEYPAPVGTDAFLSHFYGDYMKLPPKEQQVSHHKFKAWYKE